MTYYAVVRIADGSEVYCDTCLAEAEQKLGVGTCYGQGETCESARWAAQSVARKMREQEAGK